MKKYLTLLGSTGSIGTQTLDIIEHTDYKVYALCAGKNVDLLAKQIKAYNPEYAVVADEDGAEKLLSLTKGCSTKILCGRDAIIETASKGVELVLSAIVGIAGLEPTLAAIEAGSDIALANKETLVTGGELVMERVAKNNTKLLPVDSEHSAIFQCIDGKDKNGLKKIILTASGGPFFNRTREQLQNVSVENALAHPNWSMGRKISIDSATMMNKGLEVIEAMHLFSMPADKIDIVIHPQSIIHSLVEWKDGSHIAQMGLPDMKIPIQYALTYPNRVYCGEEELSLPKVGNLTFFEPDYDTFKCLSAAIKAAKMGGLYPALVNGANEQTVDMFLNGKIGFLDIGELVYGALSLTVPEKITSVEQIREVDTLGRKYVIDNASKMN